MKMPFVAILWALTTVITPATVYKQVWQSGTWLLAGAVCILIMAQILLNDLRDQVGDHISGTVSLPVLLGDSTARRIGYLLASAGILLALPVAPIPFTVTALYSAFLVWRYRRQDDTQWRAWIEGQGIVAALGTLIRF
jgi:1,4-dihydroxy-2-naphthoate octaprenyltransferase